MINTDPTPPPTPLGIRASFVRVLPDYVHSQGVDPKPVLDLLGLTEDCTNDDQQAVPSRRLAQALQYAAQRLGDEHLGLHVATQVRPAHLGSLGYALMSCTLGGDALALFEQLQSLLNTEIRTHYQVNSTQVQTRHEALGPLPTDYLFWSFLVGARLSFARWVSGRALSPILIELPCAPPNQIQPLLDFIGGPVQFHAPICQETLPADWLGWLNPNADPSTHDLMAGIAQRQLQEHTQDTARQNAQLTQAILLALEHGETPSLEWIANALESGARQIQRRLSAQGLSFKGMVEEARRERALRQLRLTTVPLSQIAAEAGYAETSSFHRAVKRWTGMTPSQLRSSPK